MHAWAHASSPPPRVLIQCEMVDLTNKYLQYAYHVMRDACPL